jgi:hypothetical protein
MRRDSRAPSATTRTRGASASRFGQTIGETESTEEAIDLADRELGANRARWVNQGVLQDEYNDYVTQG